jgi:uncharacterized protein (TIGR02246 family)
MKTTFAVTLGVVLLLFSGCSQKVDDPADMQAIKKSMDDYAKALNTGDIDQALSLMSDKAVYADNHLPVAVGKDAIRSLHKALFSQFKVEFGCPVEDVRVSGNLAVARGTWTAKMTPKTQGMASLSEGGSWTVTLARQSDGSWKWDWCEPNSNQPLPGSTATGEDEQALLQLERDWADANVKKDTAALDRILATEFQGNYAGSAVNKKQMLSALKSAGSKTESEVVSEMKAVVFGDRAVVNGLATAKSSTAGKDTSGQFRFTETFVKRDGRWQCVTGYATKMEANP